ncbi:MAG: hypothetical protein ABFS09_05165 [Thermodesulfobacteriota bacterium]
MKCSSDVTEVAHTLNGTAFKSLGTFYLGTLLPDYAAAFVHDQGVDDFVMDSGADLDISVDAIDDFGEIPDLPGDITEEDFSMAADDTSEFGGQDISLDDHDMPDMDLSSFEESDTGFRPGAPAPAEPVADVGLDDVPEFDLSGIDFDDDVDLELEDASSTPNLSDIDLSLGEEEVPDLGELEIEEKGKDNGLGELPDLEL